MTDEATERIMIHLLAKDAEFQRAMEKSTRALDKATKAWEKKTSKAARQMSADLKSAGDAVGRFAKNFAIGMAIGATTSLMSINIRGAVRDLADLKDAADRVGLSTDAFQELQYGMRLAGVDAAEFNSAMEKFAENIGDAARGGGSLLPVLQNNGIAIRDVGGQVRSTEALLRDFADLIKRTPDEASRMSLITDAFGRGGKAMVLALADGRDGFVAFGESAQKAGAVLDESIIARAADLDDRLDALAMRAKAFFDSVIVGALSSADVLSKWMADPNALGILLHDIPPESIFGAKTAENLRRNSALFSKAHDDIATIGAVYDQMIGQAEEMAVALQEAGNAFSLAGDYDSAEMLGNLSAEINGLIGDFQSGRISAEDFEITLRSIASQSELATDSLAAMDGVDLTALRGELVETIAVIDAMANRAAAALASILSLARISGTGSAVASGGAGAGGGGVITVKPVAGSVGGRGGGGGRDSTDSDAAKWFEATRTEAEKYAADLAELDKLLADGAITLDTYGRGLDLIKDKYELTGEATDFIKETNQSLQDAFLDLAVDGVNSFDAIAKAIKRAAIEAALFGSGPLAGLFGGKAGGLLGGIVSTVTGNAPPAAIPASVATAKAIAPMAANAGMAKQNIIVTAYTDEGVILNVAGAETKRQIIQAAPTIVQESVKATDRAMSKTKAFGAKR